MGHLGSIGWEGESEKIYGKDEDYFFYLFFYFLDICCCCGGGGGGGGWGFVGGCCFICVCTMLMQTKSPFLSHFLPIHTQSRHTKLIISFIYFF